LDSPKYLRILEGIALTRKSLFDETDLKLLSILQDNPRMTMSELARRVEMSSPAVTERVARLEEDGVIASYRLELNPAAFGYPLTAFVRIRPLPGQVAKVADLVKQVPEVVECHRITGEDCFILKIYLPDVSSLDRILDRFLAHGQTTTSIVQSSPVLPRPLPLPKKPG
jgi:Lrp/AsnC family transcriptional regulator, leucine-responsive regulatory protein